MIRKKRKKKRKNASRQARRYGSYVVMPIGAIVRVSNTRVEMELKDNGQERK